MKTKALISFAVTAKLICAFVFAMAKIRFSHDAAQMILYSGHMHVILVFFTFQTNQTTFLLLYKILQLGFLDETL